EIASDNSELGATLNGFSLSESGSPPLANAIETVGQAIDSSFIATTALMQALEINVNEPMQEYIQYANIIKTILKFRHQKHIQSESTADQLESKRNSLDNLERMETEAKRIEDALNRERSNTSGSTSSATPSRNDSTQQDTHSGDSHSTNPYAQAHNPSSTATKRRSTRLSVFSTLSHTLHGIIDVDPEATRRNNIGKTRDAIAQLEEQLEGTNTDLDNISRAVQGDLDRFQRQKIKDLRDILLEYAKAHQKWCQKNLGSWQEAQAVVKEIPV
ncbi:hypothetical protein EDD21DRAFT_426912, partial [Dissophora ornata]